jgi:hypothetical protein
LVILNLSLSLSLSHTHTHTPSPLCPSLSPPSHIEKVYILIIGVCFVLVVLGWGRLLTHFGSSKQFDWLKFSI